MWCNNQRFRSAIAGAFCLSLCGAATLAAADIIHVPADFPTIQAAINNAVDGDEIIVAPGTYFEMINFLGKAIDLHSSDGPEVTIIDAQLAGTVVTCDSGEGPDTILDGFTITGGDIDPDGGGMRNVASSPTVMNCIFDSNTARHDGGGMYNENANPTVIDCIFDGNTTGLADGGAMYNEGGAPIVTGCLFRDNEADDSGGGIDNNDSALVVLRSVFVENVASVGHGGGGIRTDGLPIPLITDSTFVRNWATAFFDEGTGGGVMGSANLINCVFVGNRVLCDGSAIAIVGGNKGSQIVNCLVFGNRGSDGAAAIHDALDVALDVVNCTIVANFNGLVGGVNNSTLANCILWENEGFDNDQAQQSSITYSCVQDGHAGEGNMSADPLLTIDVEGVWTAHAAYDDDEVQTTFFDAAAAFEPDALIESFLTIGPQLGLNDQDHSIIVANTATTITVWGDLGSVTGGEAYNVRELRLPSGSPCIDAGDNTAVPPDEFDIDDDGDTEEPLPIDLDGNPRFFDDPNTKDTGNGKPPIVDMGVYEFFFADCNDNGIPDDDEVATEFVAESGELGPIGAGSPQMSVIPAPPLAIGDVALDFTAFADLGGVTEFIEVFINGAPVGAVFETVGGEDCPAIPAMDQLTIDRDEFNDLVAGGDAVIDLVATDNVSANGCDGMSFITVAVSYDIESENDQNGNGIPDDCELLGDLDGDGVVGSSDLILLLGAWGRCDDCGECVADIDGDCNVGSTDLIILLGNWS